MNVIWLKEFTEYFSGGAIGKWGRYEFLVVILGTGVLWPLLVPGRLAVSGLCLIALILPVMMTGAAIADSVAGERERGTLEIVFLLPLADVQILAGKIGAALSYALILCAGSLAAGTAVLLSRGLQPPPFWEYASSLVFCFLIGIAVASGSALISLGNVTARQAQMYVFVPFYVLVFSGIGLEKLTSVFFSGGWAPLVAILSLYPVLTALLVPLGFSIAASITFALALSRFSIVRCAK